MNSSFSYLEIKQPISQNNFKFRYELPTEGLGIIDALKIPAFYLIAILNCLSVSFPSIPKIYYKVYIII